jgi:leucyl-tRNA synthetase
MVSFDVENFDKQIEVFTTRVDTIYGVSFMTLAPEHPFVKHITKDKNLKSVKDYIEKSAKKN